MSCSGRYAGAGEHCLPIRDRLRHDVLSDFSKLLAIPLHDGCDFMDVIGRRLRAQVEE